MSTQDAVRSVLASLRDPLAARLGIDRRALAVFRTALGLLVLADLLTRASHLEAFYTDAGATPRAIVHATYPAYSHLSLHALSGAAWWQWSLFGLAGAAAVALAVGYRTQLATLATLVLLVSLQVRNPLVLNAGDVLLRRLLFWGLFLPLGSRWAVDAGRASGGGVVFEPVTTTAAAGLLGQVVLVYLVNAAFKLRGGVWSEGDAVGQVLALGQFTTPLGDLLAGVTPLTTGLTWLWLALLCGSWLLLALTGWPRAALVAGFAVAHVGMLATMRIGLFPLVSVAALVPFLPPSCWDRLAGRARATSTRHTGGDRWTGWRGRLRRVGSVALVALFAGLLLWNAATLGLLGLSDGTATVVDAADREWNMFAPSPPDVERWYGAPALLATGDRVDALDGDRVTGVRPADLADSYPGPRWRKYLTRLSTTGPKGREAARAYLCRRAARAADDTVERLTLREFTRPVDGEQTTVRRLAGGGCPGW